jgi:hypothetical protein
MGMLTADVERLAGFADALGVELVAFGSDMSQEILAPLGEIIVNFGGGGLVEGFDFQQPYGRCQEALGHFLAEASMGLATLSSGAAIIAARYATGDDDSARLLAAVTDAFAPPTPAEQAVPTGEGQQSGRDEVTAFDARVAEQTELLADPDFRADALAGESGLVFPSSDYGDDSYRGFAGEGTGAVYVPGDQQGVAANVVLEPGQSEIDGIDLVLTVESGLSDEVMQDIAEIDERIADGDFPGTEHDSN